MIDQAFRNRFWSKVVVDGASCWEWTGYKDANGYGQFKDKTTRLAHRVAYELSREKIPAGMHVMHTCDNPSCCNPAHLKLGTAKDNHTDKSRKGRADWERSGRKTKIKLTDLDVVHIIRAAQSGVPRASIAAEYGITEVYLYSILSGKYRKRAYALATKEAA